MRRYAYCLILLLAPTAVWATNGLVQANNAACVYSTTTAGAALTDGSVSAPAAPAAKPTSTSTSHGGGSDGELLVPRMRMPKWHSFLPGMFR
jgi:hypothetical protein